MTTRRVSAFLVLVQLLTLFGTGAGLLNAGNSMLDCEKASMSAMPSSSHSGHDREIDDAHRNHAPDDQGQTGCRLPWAPAGCTSAAPCLPVMIASAGHGGALTADLLAPATPANDQEPLSSPTSPEPPPPRA